MNLDRERLLNLADTCGIALSDGEAEILENELNELLMLADRLHEGATVPCSARREIWSGRRTNAGDGCVSSIQTVGHAS